MPAPLRSITAEERPTCATVPRRKLIKAWLLSYPNISTNTVPSGRRFGPLLGGTARFELRVGPGTLRRGECRAGRGGRRRYPCGGGTGRGDSPAGTPRVRDRQGQGV